MEAHLDKSTIPRPSFVIAVEQTPRTAYVDASDIKRNLYGDFSSTSDLSQRDILESKEPIHVCLRIRPLMQSEKEADSQDCVSILDPTSIILKAPKSSMVFRLSEKNSGQMVQKFTFSQVFGPETTQEEFFEGTVKPLVQDFLKGRSRLVFTYGVTNAGKTYTYQGTDENAGIVPRALNTLFKCIKGRLYTNMDLKPHRCRDHRKLTKEKVKEEMAVKSSLLRLVKEVDYHYGINGHHSKTSDNSDELDESLKEAEPLNMDEGRGAQFSVWVSFCEIYNECIYDLLLPISNDKRRKVLRVAQDIKGCSYVKDLQWIQVSNSNEAFRLMKLGLKRQSFASTKLNANSSRSHSIFTVKMLKIDSEATRVMQVSELFLCDLAGSERCTRTHNEGERLKESGNINTSLHILGKCIHALKTSQQSKLQQHIPFRESKLTHFFQGFFSGKGKVCMVVNVSQSASAYDETLHVLKFSAIAQKVMVLDASSSPQEESFDQMPVQTESEISIEDVLLPAKRQRATLLWERTLEDVLEDEEELVPDSCGVHEVNHMAENNVGEEVDSEVIDETPSQAGDDEDDEDDSVVIQKEYYQRLLNIIEDLKNKFINERRDKLFMEQRIRGEVTEECARYLAENNDHKVFIDQKQDTMEDNCEKRMQLYKDLVKDRILLTHGREREEDTQSNEQDETLGGESGELGNSGILYMVDSLQQNVTDIKQQAETVFGLLNALEDPQMTIERLRTQLAEVTAELSKTQEEVLYRRKEAEMQENRLSESAKILQDATEKMTAQNKQVKELTQIVEQKDDEIRRLQDLISHFKSIIKDSETTIATIKQEMEHTNSNKKSSCTHSSDQNVGTVRKRYLESGEEEGPPAKQGSINSAKDAIETKKLEEIQPHTFKEEGVMVALEEKNKMLEMHVATLGAQLEKEKIESGGFSSKITSLSQELSSSEERAAVLSSELQKQEANCEVMKSELVALKDINKRQEEMIQMLHTEIGKAKQTIADKKAMIKAVEVKMGELSKLGSQCLSVDVDLTSGKKMVKPPKERHEQTLNFGRKSSFHCSVESIWEVSKGIIQASTQKRDLIEDLRQQVEQLQRRVLGAEDEKRQLKLSETINQVDTFMQEKEGLLNQLRVLQQENALYSEKYREEESKALGYLEKIKKMDGLLDECRVKEAKIVCLEQALKDKESAILVMEGEVKDLQGKLNVSESKIKKLHAPSVAIPDQVLELRNNLRTIKLEEKNQESKRALERLNKELLESTSLSSRLQIEIQRKDEEYADLKEKMADAKKQIEQVQAQVCGMHAKEKVLGNKVNEVEKAKSQLTEELVIKQRTIQQLKDQLNKKLEDASQQYQQACKELCSKDKIIEDMKLTLEEQEQTQLEQDHVLEAKSEECESLVAELEEWKKRYHELEKQTGSLGQQNINVECERRGELPSEELKRLNDQLKECEEQHKIDRKKWLTEKMILITQAKEAETYRNREMKKFAADREQHAKQLAEAEKLLTGKDHDLQKWRIERDQLVAALEVQLTSLISSNTQKDKDIEELKKCALKAPGKNYETPMEELGRQSAEKDDDVKELKQISCENSGPVILPGVEGTEENKVEGVRNCKQLKLKQTDPGSCNDVEDTDSLLQSSSRASSVEDTQDQTEAILDSCEVSAESDQTSRFPKPEMEIHFTPLQPNKMEVKHQGSPSAVTIKMPKARKRKSSAMEENILRSENERDAASPATASIWPDSFSRPRKKTSPGQSLKKDYSLRSKRVVSSIKSPGNPGGTLQKFSTFLQSSPMIMHSKAKKLMATIKSPKSTEEESGKENDQKTKRMMRRLYSTAVSSPMEFSGHVIVMDQKESDHEIIKRRLRKKKAH